MSNKIEINLKKTRKNAIVPNRATEGSAGFDLCACINESIEIKPGELLKIPTGIALQLPNKNYAAMIFARSGLGVKHGITLSNGVGVVDSDYRGEICVGLCNVSSEPYTIIPNERIAQIVIMPVCPAVINLADSLDDTNRGDGGFGSTGK